jgi:hypothetical protein
MTDVSSEAMEARRQWDGIFKMPKKKKKKKEILLY